jgi:hypothetical protein
VAGLGGFLVVAVILSSLLFFYVRRAHKTEENTSSEVELPMVKGEEHSPRESVDSTYNDKPVEDVAVSTLVPRQTATVTRPSIARTRFSQHSVTMSNSIVVLQYETLERKMTKSWPTTHQMKKKVQRSQKRTQNKKAPSYLLLLNSQVTRRKSKIEAVPTVSRDQIVRSDLGEYMLYSKNFITAPFSIFALESANNSAAGQVQK